jgi:protein-tyrosine phosphatase
MKHVSGRLYRGPRPVRLGDLVRAGVSFIIDLQSGVFEQFHNDPYEYEKYNPIFRITFLHLRLSDFWAPSEAQCERFLAFVASATSKVYAHCWKGVDRTGFMCALYRIVIDGWTYRDAVKEMLDEGFHIWVYWYWLPVLWWRAHQLKRRVA